MSPSFAGPYEDAEAAIKADNEDRALAVLQPLAAKGETRAQFEVGQLLYLFKKKDIEAKRLFELAAAKGHGEAMYYLGNIYQNGTSVRQNYVEAYKWYILAVVHASPRKPGYGDPKETATKNRDFLAAKMTAAQISEAQRLASARKQKPWDYR
jgi:TPR repeat protein